MDGLPFIPKKSKSRKPSKDKEAKKAKVVKEEENDEDVFTAAPEQVATSESSVKDEAVSSECDVDMPEPSDADADAEGDEHTPNNDDDDDQQSPAEGSEMEVNECRGIVGYEEDVLEDEDEKPEVSDGSYYGDSDDDGEADDGSADSEVSDDDYQETDSEDEKDGDVAFDLAEVADEAEKRRAIEQEIADDGDDPDTGAGATEKNIFTFARNKAVNFIKATKSRCFILKGSETATFLERKAKREKGSLFADVRKRFNLPHEQVGDVDNTNVGLTPSPNSRAVIIALYNESNNWRAMAYIFLATEVLTLTLDPTGRCCSGWGNKLSLLLEQAHVFGKPQIELSPDAPATALPWVTGWLLIGYIDGLFGQLGAIKRVNADFLSVRCKASISKAAENMNLTIKSLSKPKRGGRKKKEA